MLIDLHIHSNFSSDGEYSPLSICDIIKDKRISIFSITDHNTIKGVKELLLKNGLNHNIVFIPGVEFSCSYKGNEIHLLSYGFHYLDERFEFLEERFKKIKKEQAVKRALKLQELGFVLDVDEVLKFAGDKAASGVTFLNVLKQDKKNREKLNDYLEGTKSNSPYTNFYFDFFRKGGFAYVEIELFNYFEIVNLLKDTFLVLAHPGLYPDELIDDILVDKISGIEAYSSYHDIKQCEKFIELAKERDLIVTCGSDFHGENIKPGVDFIDYEIEPDFQTILIEKLGSLANYLI